MKEAGEMLDRWTEKQIVADEERRPMGWEDEMRWYFGWRESSMKEEWGRPRPERHMEALMFYGRGR